MKNTKLRAFLGSKKVKDKYIERMKEHMRLDQLMQGTGFERAKNRGCAVGCTLDKYEHTSYTTELGLPVWLAHLEDKIFEKLPKEKAMKFPLKFLESVQIGVDYTLMWHDWSIFLLTKIIPKKYVTQKDIKDIINLHKRAAKGGIVTEEEWRNTTSVSASAWASVSTGAWASARASARASASARAWAGVSANACASASESERAWASASARACASARAWASMENELISMLKN